MANVKSDAPAGAMLAFALCLASGSAFAQPAAFECTIRHVVTDTSAAPATQATRPEAFMIDEAQGVGCIMAGGICHPLYSRLKVSRSAEVVSGAGSTLVGGNTVALTYYPNSGRATVAYTYVGLSQPSQDTYISGPGDCRKLATVPELNHLF